MKIFIDKSRCRGSGECIKVCPNGALHLVRGRAAVDYERCDLDGLCIPACPHDAISFTDDA